MKLINCYFIFLFICGCSSTPNSAQKDLSTVTVSDELEDKHIVITEIKPEEMSRDSYDVPLSSDYLPVTDLTKESNKVIGLYFSGGLYNTFYHLAVLKYMEENDIKPHVVSGEGAGLIIAAMYAAGKTVDEMEWVFFKLHSKMMKIQNKNDWMKLIIENVVNGFDNRSIQLFQKTLFIADKRMRKNILSGSIEELLKEYTSREIDYGEYSLRKKFKEFGVDRVYLSSVVPTRNIYDYDVIIRTKEYDLKIEQAKQTNLYSVMKELVIEKSKVIDEVKNY